MRFEEYFDIDRVSTISVDNSPRYKKEIIEETDRHIIMKTEWGTTLKQLKDATSSPHFLDFTIKDPDSWEKAKKEIYVSEDRVDWNFLKKNYPIWQKEGHWIEAGLWFGFDITHSWIVGTVRILEALAEQPDWVVDMYSHLLEVNLGILELVWDAGYKFDCVSWPDDMGYKNNQFFSKRMYRKMSKPFHKRAIEWAHEKDIKTRLHSCGDINPFIPELIEVGLDAINPLEVKAGMDPVHLKKTYGDKIVLHGGINAVLWDDPGAIEAELERLIPILKENGGYIFSSDHSVPNTVSLEAFRNIVEKVKILGKY
jgi:uroporphyrinogen decarboxylase